MFLQETLSFVFYVLFWTFEMFLLPIFMKSICIYSLTSIQTMENNEPVENSLENIFYVNDLLKFLAILLLDCFKDRWNGGIVPWISMIWNYFRETNHTPNS